MPDPKRTQIKSGARKPSNSSRQPVTRRPAAPSGPSLSRMKETMGHGQKVVFAILLAVIAISSVAFFAGAGSIGDSGGSSAQSAGSQVVIKVGKADITRADLQQGMSRMLQMFGGQIGFNEQPMVWAMASEQLVRQQVELQAAKASGAKVTDEDFNKAVNLIIDQKMKQVEDGYATPEDYAKFLASENRSKATERESMRSELEASVRQQGKNLRDVMNDDLLVQAYKRKFEEALTLPRFVRYSQIVVGAAASAPAKPGTPAPNRADAASKASADSLMTQLKGGADFAKLATDKSTDTYSKTKGGDMGYVDPASKTAQPYLKDLASAKLGDLLGPVSAPDGWHIIKVTGDITKLPPGLDKATDDEKQATYPVQQAADEQYNKKLEDLVKAAQVVYVDPVIRGAMAQKKSDTKTALMEYQKALAAKPALLPADTAWVAYACGQLLMSQNDATQALTMFQKATTARSSSAEAWMAVGDAQSKLKQNEQAITSYKKALDLAEGDASSLSQIAQKFNDLKDTADAKIASDKASEAAAKSNMGRFGNMGGMMPMQAPGGGTPVKTYTVKTPPAKK